MTINGLARDGQCVIKNTVPNFSSKPRDQPHIPVSTNLKVFAVSSTQLKLPPYTNIKQRVILQIRNHVDHRGEGKSSPINSMGSLLIPRHRSRALRRKYVQTRTDFIPSLNKTCCFSSRKMRRFFGFSKATKSKPGGMNANNP